MALMAALIAERYYFGSHTEFTYQAAVMFDAPLRRTLHLGTCNAGHVLVALYKTLIDLL